MLGVFINFLFIVFYCFFCIFLYIRLRKNKSKLPVNIISLSFLYHLIFCLSYWLMSIEGIADAKTYYNYVVYRMPESWLDYFGIGTSFIRFFLFPLVKYFHLSYFSCFLIFNFIGYLGLLFFYIALRKKIFHHLKLRKLLNLVLFIPGLNYWTSAIGKDSIITLGLGLLLYGLGLNTKSLKKNVLIFLALITVFVVRPHIALFIVLGLFFAFFFSKLKINFLKKILVLALVIFTLFSAKSFVLEYAGLGKANNVRMLYEFVTYRQSLNLEGGSSVNISNYSVPMKLFTYLFRPLLVDAKNPLMFIISFENLFYIILFSSIFSLGFWHFLFKNFNFYLRFNLFYFLITLLVMANTTTNLGIAVRQKTMIMFSLITIIFLYKCYSLDERACILQQAEKSGRGRTSELN